MVDMGCGGGILSEVTTSPPSRPFCFIGSLVFVAGSCLRPIDSCITQLKAQERAQECEWWTWGAGAASSQRSSAG